MRQPLPSRRGVPRSGGVCRTVIHRQSGVCRTVKYRQSGVCRTVKPKNYNTIRRPFGACCSQFAWLTEAIDLENHWIMNTDCTDIKDDESVLIRVIRVQKKSNYPSATKTKKNVKITPILLKHLKSSKITKNHSRATTNCSLSLYKAIFGCCPLVVRLMSACCPL